MTISPVMAIKRHATQPSLTRQEDLDFPGTNKSDESKIVRHFAEPWTPTTGLAFKLLISARLCSALWSNISDCDETFNYWEPAHYLQYGKGFQTWEYSPTYAIRSYAYILLHVMPMKLCILILGNEKILVFYMTRCVLGVACAASEMLFYKGVLRVFGPNVARLTLVLQLFAAGMFTSATAFLPSCFSMYLTMVAYGLWLLDKHNLAVMSVAGSAILGWPFAVALGIPIAVDILLIRKKVFYFVKWCAVSFLVFLMPSVLIDMYYYGKPVVAPLNIVLYNVFSGHGPELYGTEPLSYYLMNGFLNYNLAFVLALGSLPVLVFISFFVKLSSNKRNVIWLSLAPMYIWILIFFTRPHKEERFLFPMYPFLSLSAALVLDAGQRLLRLLLPGASAKVHYTHNTNFVTALFSLSFALMSLSRIVAVYQGYSASMSIYLDLNHMASNPDLLTPPPSKTVNVCVGKEWYRFPSSFFLPGDNWNLQFLQSEFRGQLPKPYEDRPDGTRTIPSAMNDMNREEPSRYVDLSICHYLIDRDTEDWTTLEPRFATSRKWTLVNKIPFLDTSRSHSFFRAFYIPFLSESHCSYTSYSLLKASVPKKHSKTLKRH